MPISNDKVLSLPVSDQDRSINFYVDVLGLELLSGASMGPSMRWVQVALKGATTSITLVTWFPSMSPGSLNGLVLETGALDSDVALLRSKGVVIEGGIQEQPWGRLMTLTATASCSRSRQRRVDPVPFVGFNF
jgi:catechol 2,3-dioxygenase-like lactoylglutathione lyase family enzyme